LSEDRSLSGKPKEGQIMDDRPAQDGPDLMPRRPGRLATQGNKQPLNLRMDAGVILRLKRHALDQGRTVSDLVTELVQKHLDNGSASDGPRSLAEG
jgi:hypothetical protein